MTLSEDPTVPVKWGKVIDNSLCIGCHACTIACKAENQVPLGVTRTFVKYTETGTFPDVDRQFQVTRCNQCEEPPCVHSCPVTAMFQRPDGIVDFDSNLCIGCKACIAACPYDAIFINPESHTAEKCNFCAHRVDNGLEPACVVVCPTQAIIVGDLNEPDSHVSRALGNSRAVEVRRPEKETQPKLSYVNSKARLLEPTEADRLELVAWGQPTSPGSSTRATAPTSTSAAALVAYGNTAKAPWDWRVSAYTWTKSIGAGVLLLLAFISIGGGDFSRSWQISAAIVALLFMALTGVFLVADLTHPARFFYVLIRPQWRSWLARGAYIIAAYVVAAALFLVAALLREQGVVDALRWPVIILAIPCAVYTAYILRQSKGRDLWQNPLLPGVFFVEAILAGAAALLILRTGLSAPAGTFDATALALAGSAALLALSIVSELLVHHESKYAAAAAFSLIHGNFGRLYWSSLALVIAAALLGLFAYAASSIGIGAVGGLLALAGLFTYEHAYIQAGQSAPQS